MRTIVVIALVGAWVVLRLLAWPIVRLGVACVWIARPITELARRCLEKAREWDPRLYQRDQHTDLHPPPRS